MAQEKEKNEFIFSLIAQFHEFNLYLPTRTIYFGGGFGINIEEDSDAVNCRTVSQFIKNLHILSVDSNECISVLLNSPGGSWEDGIACYDLMRKIKSDIAIIGLGKLYSMGSVLFQAGDKRFIYPNTTMMIHDGTDGYIGDPKSFESWAKNSKHTREVMYKIYYSRMKKKLPKITLKDIEEMCSHDKIFTAKEAVKFGLADKII